MLKKFKNPLVYIVLILTLAFGARYFFSSQLVKNGNNESTQAFFAASFPNEIGKTQAIKQYENKIIVLNFWASWCEPCREEMPELSALHDEFKDRNVMVLGMAIEDVAAVNDFLKETKVSYPLFAADIQGMEIATLLGNNKGVLPYTVIINADGSIVKSYFGRVTKPLLEKSLLPLLQK